MDYARVTEMSRKLTQDGSVLDYGPDRSRLLLRVLRTLATGRPVSGEQVEQISTQWAAGRGDIAILSVDEGYKMGRQLWARFLAYAA